MTHLSQCNAPLLRWYDTHKRTLPWRGTTNPYHIWVSEIMLQQTRVAAVIPYYERWMKRLPTVQDLAEIHEEELLKLWEGLGYYSRVRNLQKAARVIMEDLGGQFPTDFAALKKLPGIGEYTAAAIASIAYGERVPAVDGNLLRVTARVEEIADDILDPKAKKKFFDLLLSAMPEERPGDYNQALMDLGATVCLPNGAPLCEECPLKPLCLAHGKGIEQTLPVRRKKAKRRVEERTVFLLRCGRETALCKRPDTGLLAGLWEFPSVEGKYSAQEAITYLKEHGLKPMELQKSITAKHIFTHVEWHMTGYLVSVDHRSQDYTWTEQLSSFAIPSAFSKFTESL